MTEHKKWPSFSNIHKVALSPEFFDKTFSFGEKIDGSNLGIQVKRGSTDATLHGRNSIVSYDFEKPTSVKYGNAGSLGELPINMRQFASKLCNLLHLHEVIVYGEAYKHGKQKFASYHPFGYRVEDTFFGLTRESRELFIQCVPEEDAHEYAGLTAHEAYLESLESAERHVVFPPIIYKTSSLAEGIHELHASMKQPGSKLFEGVFCVCEEDGFSIPHSDCNLTAFKWKTGHHEEQSGMPPLERLCLCAPEHLELYHKLAEVFSARPFANQAAPATAASPSTAKPTADAELRGRISAAFQRELGKMESFQDLPKKERGRIVVTMKPLVAAEVIRSYEEDGEEVGEEKKKNITKLSDKLVISLVMGV
jgi:hypothetical protein